jgi:hypothetical protein
LGSSGDSSRAGWRSTCAGIHPPRLLWSHDQGKVAFSKFVANGTSITGLALSPVLTDVNVDRYPLLSSQVFCYNVHDITNGTHSTLHVGVNDGAQTNRLLTITPSVSLSCTFNLSRGREWYRGRRGFPRVYLVPHRDDAGRQKCGGDGGMAVMPLDNNGPLCYIAIEP